MANAFPWFVTYGIKANPVTPRGLRDTTPQSGPNEDVRDLSRGDCDAPNLIDCMMCVGV